VARPPLASGIAIERKGYANHHSQDCPDPPCAGACPAEHPATDAVVEREGCEWTEVCSHPSLFQFSICPHSSTGRVAARCCPWGSDMGVRDASTPAGR
jgi:hypothetical protein